MVDIQSVAAEIRRGKKERRKKERKIETTGQKYNVNSRVNNDARSRACVEAKLLIQSE